MALVGIDVAGIEEITRKLAKLPNAVVQQVIDDVSDFMVKAMRVYPKPDHTKTRKMAYGRTWFTEKQRRWFFWALRTGRIHVPYQRTRQMRDAWRVIDRGKNALVVNETDAAYFTQDAQGRARYSKLVGWKTTAEIIRRDRDKINKLADKSINKAMRRLRMK